MNANVAPAPQLTARAIILAIVLAMILAAANTYLGLFAGMTIASAIPAAVVSMAVLRALGGGGILENNIVQTGASAGTSIASGVIFTVPALVLMGYWPDFKYWWVLAIAGLGGLLGVLFSVPLRRSLIVDQQMTFPEGKAAAEVLRAGENPSQGVKVLGIAALVGGIGKVIAASGLRLIPDSALASGFIGKYLGYMGTNISPALLGVGYIVGLNIGAVVVSGSLLSFNIAIPLYHAYFLPQNPELAATVAAACQGLSSADCAETTAQILRGAQIRYLGVGAMLVGGLWALVSLRKSIVSGVKSGLAAARAGSMTNVPHTDRDLPMKWVLIGIVVFTHSSGRPLLQHRRQRRGRRGDVGHHDRRGFPVLLRVCLHGGPGGLVQQSGVGHHHRDHPVRGAGVVRLPRQGLDDRPGGRGHDRRRGVLRGLRRGRQPAGSQGGLSRGCNAVAATGDAGNRLGVLRADHGAGAEHAGRTVMASARAPRNTRSRSKPLRPISWRRWPTGCSAVTCRGNDWPSAPSSAWPSSSSIRS